MSSGGLPELQRQTGIQFEVDVSKEIFTWKESWAVHSMGIDDTGDLCNPCRILG